MMKHRSGRIVDLYRPEEKETQFEIEKSEKWS